MGPTVVLFNGRVEFTLQKLTPALIPMYGWTKLLLGTQVQGNQHEEQYRHYGFPHDNQVNDEHWGTVVKAEIRSGFLQDINNFCVTFWGVFYGLFSISSALKPNSTKRRDFCQIITTDAIGKLGDDIIKPRLFQLLKCRYSKLTCFTESVAFCVHVKNGLMIIVLKVLFLVI
jgi:hypothetical protein